MEAENVMLLLNDEGEDFQVSVDLQTANILLNDPREATKFIKQLKMKIPSTESELATSSAAVCSSQERPKVPPSHSSPIVWTSKRPTENDMSATEYFLNLREKYSRKFDDRKTIKSQLWNKIANEMKEAGYNLGEGSDLVEKLRLKFSGLQKQYHNYIKHVNSTGEKYKEKPQYFDSLHSILGKKDLSSPKGLQDSLSSQHQTMESTDVPNRFHTERDKKPTTAATQIVKLLEKQTQERSEQFSRLEIILKEQNKHREELLNEFKKLVELKQNRDRTNS